MHSIILILTICIVIALWALFNYLRGLQADVSEIRALLKDRRQDDQL